MCIRDRLLKSLEEQGAATSQNSPTVYFRVGASPLHVHASFNRLSPIVDRLPSGALVQLVERRSGWAKVLVGQGFRLWLDGTQLSGVSTRGWREEEKVKVFAEVEQGIVAHDMPMSRCMKHRTDTTDNALLC